MWLRDYYLGVGDVSRLDVTLSWWYWHHCRSLIFDESGHGWARIASSLSFGYAEHDCLRTIDTWDEFILLYLWKQNSPCWPPCCEFKCLREKLLLCARNRRFGTLFKATESRCIPTLCHDTHIMEKLQRRKLCKT